MDQAIKSDVINILVDRGFKALLSRNISRPLDGTTYEEIYAVNSSTHQRCVLEIRYGYESMVMTSGMLSMVNMIKSADKKGPFKRFAGYLLGRSEPKPFYGVITPYGATITADNIAKNNNIRIYKDIESFSAALDEYTKEASGGN